MQKAFVGAYGLLGERNHVRRVTLFSGIVHCNDEHGLLGTYSNPDPHRTVFLHALNFQFLIFIEKYLNYRYTRFG